MPQFLREAVVYDGKFCGAEVQNDFFPVGIP